MQFIFARRKTLYSWSFQVMTGYCMKIKWAASFGSSFYITVTIWTTRFPAMARFCMLMPVNLLKWIGTFPIAQISMYAIAHTINFNSRCKVSTVLPLSSIYIKQWDGNFPKTNKNEIFTSQQILKGLKLQSVQLLQVVVSSST